MYYSVYRHAVRVVGNTITFGCQPELWIRFDHFSRVVFTEYDVFWFWNFWHPPPPTPPLPTGDRPDGERSKTGRIPAYPFRRFAGFWTGAAAPTAADRRRSRSSRGGGGGAGAGRRRRRLRRRRLDRRPAAHASTRPTERTRRRRARAFAVGRPPSSSRDLRTFAFRVAARDRSRPEPTHSPSWRSLRTQFNAANSLENTTGDRTRRWRTALTAGRAATYVLVRCRTSVDWTPTATGADRNRGY